MQCSKFVNWPTQQGSSPSMTADQNQIYQDLNTLKHLTAKLLIQQLSSRGILRNLQDAEFRVHSQFGDDGIIQYINRVVGIEPKIFIEFGVENYLEANTRFLLT